MHLILIQFNLFHMHFIFILFNLIFWLYLCILYIIIKHYNNTIHEYIDEVFIV